MSPHSLKRLSWFQKPGFETARDILVITAIVAFIGFAAFAFKNLMVSGEYRTEYEGSVVAKSIRVHESQEGSWEEKCLMIMDRTQTQFQVVVPAGIYERANVGMWIKKDKKGFELSAAKDSGVQ
jgi:hypothetical protein